MLDKRESLVQNPTHLWPPGHDLGGHVHHLHCTALVLPFGLCSTLLTDNKSYLGEG